MITTVKNYLISGGISLVIVAAIGGVYYEVSKNIKHESKKDAVVEVAYSADISTTKDAPIILGYPGSRFTITCSSSPVNSCFLEVENGKKKEFKEFPYIVQEWFTPEHNNRPWHTLDTIRSLPSYSGDKELKVSIDPKKNFEVFSILDRNGWIKE